MKKILIAIALASSMPTTGFAGDESRATPVQLNANEIAIIARALDLAATTCVSQIDGCAIGSARTALLPKLQAAAKAISENEAKR